MKLKEYKQDNAFRFYNGDHTGPCLYGLDFLFFPRFLGRSQAGHFGALSPLPWLFWFARIIGLPS